MFGLSAETWSALAAGASAIAAIAIFWTNRTLYLHQARPEIVLTDWCREPDEWSDDTLKAKAIRNVGNGVALHVSHNDGPRKDGSSVPVNIVFGSRLDVLGPGDRVETESVARLLWKNVETYQHMRFQFVYFEFTYQDLAGRDYRTRYLFLVNEGLHDSSVDRGFGPGVTFGKRYTIVKPAIIARIQKTFARTVTRVKTRVKLSR